MSSNENVSWKRNDGRVIIHFVSTKRESSRPGLNNNAGPQDYDCFVCCLSWILYRYLLCSRPNVVFCPHQAQGGDVGCIEFFLVSNLVSC